MWIRGICNFCNAETLDKSYVCDSCYEEKVKPANARFVKHSYVKDTLYLENYGNVSKARIDELNRRHIVEYKKDGSYILGRKGENGKIQDRSPDYY
jgi:hypothetical protein